MKYDLKSIAVEELSYKVTGIRFDPNAKVEMQPHLERNVRMAKESSNVVFITLSLQIKSTEDAPKPIEATIRLTGLFFVEDDEDDAEKRRFVIEATNVLFPYLRAALTNLTASAYGPPVILPLPSGPIFPDDMD